MTSEDGVRIGLWERKKRETRVALSMAAIRLGIERGWANVTIEDIAGAANVSVRTFRNYFSNKAEAVAARHLDRMLSIAEALRVRPAAEPLWDAVAGAVQAQFPPDQPAADQPQPASHQRWADGVRLLFTEPALHGEMAKAHAAAQTALAAAVAERTGTDAARDVYPNLVAAAVGAAIGVAVEHSMRADPPVSLTALVRDVLDQLTAGLPTP